MLGAPSLSEASSAGPWQTEQRSEPERPRSWGGLGGVGGNGQAFPLTRHQGEKQISAIHAVVRSHAGASINHQRRAATL